MFANGLSTILTMILLVCSAVFTTICTILEPSTIPHAVLIIADYQYKSAFVADQEINMLACLTEIMSRGKFK